MTTLTWDAIGERFYESGISKAVLYLADGSGVPWNGLVSVDETLDEQTTPLYFDSIKYLDSQSSEDFQATLTAFTYPDEFLEFEGYYSFDSGLYVDDQTIQRFGLSYRTEINDDLDSLPGYKIHLVYNLSVDPTSTTFDTQADTITPINFSWTIRGVPEDLSGFRSTAHVIFDSRFLHPVFMAELEAILYGDDDGDALLLSLEDLAAWAFEWGIIRITDHGDGTWTAEGPADRITMLDATTFQITDVDATYLDADTYNISTTRV